MLADDSTTAIVVEGEFQGATGWWLEALAGQRLTGNRAVVAIDLTLATGTSGHLLGSLQRLAAFAGERAALGVVASGDVAAAIRPHAPSVTVAGTRDELFAALGVTCEADVLSLVGPRLQPGWSADRSARPETAHAAGGRGFQTSRRRPGVIAAGIDGSPGPDGSRLPHRHQAG